MPSRRVTLLDVARRAGVGKTTASDALTGVGRVSPETRELVQQAARELSYVPNSSARNLRKASTGAIGLHLPFALSRSDYYMSFVLGAADEALLNDFDVMLIPGEGRQGRPTPRVDGLIISDPSSDDDYVLSLLDSGLPVVSCERALSGKPPVATVRSPHDEAMTELLEHLRSRGSRRPAVVIPGPDTDWSASVITAYQTWCSRHLVEPILSDIDFVPSLEEVRSATRELLTSHPEVDSIVFGPDRAAAEILPLLDELGRTVGVDLLIASLIDSPSLRVATPDITAIDLNPAEAGRKCAALLSDVLDGTGFESEILMPVSLAIRASTQPR